MHSMSDEIKFMIYVNANEVIEKLFESFFSRYEIGELMNDFIFDGVSLLYYKCHEINLNRGGSYIDSPDWIRSNNKSHQQRR